MLGTEYVPVIYSITPATVLQRAASPLDKQESKSQMTCLPWLFLAHLAIGSAATSLLGCPSNRYGCGFKLGVAHCPLL